MNIVIVAEHLSKRFEDGFEAVKDVDLRVRPGEALALLGSNGAGKTTTVHMLLGYLPPTAGRALLAGVDVNEDPLEAKKHVGYVSENVLLYGALTAEQNLRFFHRISGRTDRALDVAALLARVGLGDVARRRVETFSKGMRQRLGIAIALQKDPPAMVFDEPTTGLDPEGVERIADLFVELKQEGKALLVVTHDLYRLKEISDRIAVMAGGRVTKEVASAGVADVVALYHEAMGVGR